MNKIMIDTNVVLDVLFMRDEFYENSNKILQLCEERNVSGYITTSSLMDIRYFIFKCTHDKCTTSKAIKELINFLNVVEVTKDDIFVASNDDVKDFEDYVIESCAIRNKMDFVITRNSKHFDGTKIKVLSPYQYLH